MIQPVLIAPSLLSADFGRLAEEAQRAQQSGADWLHCDVMDGHFVPNMTIGPDVIRAVRKATTLPLDVHLMIERPDRLVGRFIEAGADHVSVHIEPESRHNVAATLDMIQRQGKRAGLAINPGTPAEAALPFLDRVDELLCMTVNPGFGGQAFLAEVLPKIRVLRDAILRRGRSVDILVDGGVNTRTGPACVEHGANVLVAGNSLFGHPTLALAPAIAELRQICSGE